MNISDLIAMRRLSWTDRESGVTLQVKREYDGEELLYAGIAPRGAADSDSVWMVCKFTYDSEGRPLNDTPSAANVRWSDRATISY